MKKKLTILFISLAATTIAQNNLDSLYKIQQKQLSIVSQSIERLEEQNNILQQTIINQATQLDSLREQVAVNSMNLQTMADSMGVQIKQTHIDIQENAHTIYSNTTLLFIFIGIALLVAVCVALLLHKKQKASSQNEISKLKEQADELNGKVIEKLSEEITELQSIAKNISETNSNPSPQTKSSSEPDHSLIKTLADRITFMEMTLYKMDESIRGHKQLSKSIKQMKDNLLANGYELVAMLGQEYNDGMKVVANFIEDENLEPGKQIITGIIKPQINYQGEMIQSAQITVSQNL